MLNKNKTRLFLNKKPYYNIFVSFLFILSFLLILFNKADYFLINKVKSVSIDYLAPFTRIISTPIDLINNTLIRIVNIKNLNNKNLKLKEEIVRLKKWQTLAIKNSRENKVFKRLLNSTSHQVDIIKTASVISQNSISYAKLITINAGLNFGLTKDLAIINEKGLVGKIIFTSEKNSRILMINDPTSSISVKNLSDVSFSILTGTNNGKYLKSSFVKDNQLPKNGDLLVTSGNARIFPRDILVAKVIDVKDNYYIALPYVDFNNLNYVQVVKSK